MIQKVVREVPLFEQLGLFTEAPKKKRKPRVISVRPIKKDYTSYVDPDEEFDLDDEEIDDLGDDMTDYDVIDDGLEDEEPEDLGIDALDDLELDDIGEEDIDNAVGDEQPTEEVPVENPQPEEPIQEPTQEENPQLEEPPSEGETPPATTEEVPTETQETPPEQPTEEVPADAGGGEVIDATGEEDPEATGDLGGDVQIDETPIDGTDPNAAPTGDGAEPPQESVTKDDLRKFELYKRFMDLYNSIQYFIEKLENCVSDNEKFDYSIKKALSKFRKLEELTKDYMILKFQSDKFLQNSFFYEKIKACSLLAIELLNTNKIDKSKE